MAGNTGPNIVQQELVFYVDAGNTTSYPGSGTSWTSIGISGSIGTLNNGPTFNSLNLGSIVFDGSDDYVDFGNILLFGTTNTFTISTWSYIDNFPGISLNYILSRRSFGGTSGRMDYSILIENNNILSYARDLITGGPVFTRWFIPTLSVGQWFNITISKPSSTTVSAYFNGTFLSTQTGNHGPFALAPSFALGVGNANSLTNTPIYYNGGISNVQVYNRVLSDTEVQQNFNALRGRYGI